MRHVFWLESRLAGRPGPTEEEWSAPALKRAGIDAILNVSEHEEPTSECRALGIDVVWVPMPVTCPPEEEDEAECAAAIPEAYGFVASHLANHRTVLVHCVRGCDRTGLVLAHHLTVTQGLPPERALATVRRVRPEAITAPGWEDMALRVMRDLA